MKKQERLNGRPKDIRTKEARGKILLIIGLCLLVAVFVFFAVEFFLYLTNANDELPMSDFWLGFGQFVEKVQEGKLTISDFFPIPHPIHWNANGTPFMIFMMKVFSYNNRAFIFIGMVFNLITLALVLYWSDKHLKPGNGILAAVFGFAFALALTNLNQWEILDLFCSGFFMMRILLFLLYFILVDRWLLAENKTEKWIWKRCILLGLLGVVIMVGWSAAYYPGFVSAVWGIMILQVLVNREELSLVKKRVVLAVILLIGVLGLLFTTSSNSGVDSGTEVGFVYIRGFLVMLGSSVLPITIDDPDMSKRLFLGACFFVITCFSIILFFKKKLYRISWFPMACLIYAGVSVALIVYGRSDSFGFGSLISSRYVSETTIGLLGNLIIQAMAFCESLKEPRKKRIKLCLVSIMVMFLISGLIIKADLKEMEIGPYRKIYNQQMIQLALNIDNATDEELSIFQAPADQVRSGIEAMKRYHLCLWDPHSAYYSEAIAAQEAGAPLSQTESVSG